MQEQRLVICLAIVYFLAFDRVKEKSWTSLNFPILKSITNKKKTTVLTACTAHLRHHPKELYISFVFIFLFRDLQQNANA